MLRFPNRFLWIQKLLSAISSWRLVWLLALIALQWLYFPINRAAQGGIVLSTPLDALIPLWPIWTVPYLLSIGWWSACLLWAAWGMEDKTYRAFILSAAVVMLVSYAIYLIYPTYVVRPVVDGNTWDMQMVKWVYSHDRPYNAFPSSHTYMVILLYLFWRRWYPRLGWLWGGMAALVLVSTLFTRQHNLPDLLGGTLLAWAGYRCSLWWLNKNQKGIPRFQINRSLRRWMGLWGFYILLGVGIFIFFTRFPSDGTTGDLGSITPDGFQVQWVIENRPGGLQVGDVILRAAGFSLDEWLNGASNGDAWHTGEVVTYTIQRDGQILNLPIRMEPVSSLSVLRYRTIQLGVIVILYITTAYVFLKRYWELSTQLFAVFCFTAALHAWRDLYNFPFPLLSARGMFWVQWVLEQGTYALAWSFVCHFFLVFPHPHPWLERFPRLTLTIVHGSPWLAMLLAMLFTPTWVLAIAASNRAVIAVSMVQLAVAVIAVFRSMLIVQDPVARAQARWIALGTVAPVLLIGLGYFLPIVFGSPPFLPHPFIVVTLVFIPLVMGIAVLRYRLWDIDFIINRSLVYGSLTAVIVAIYLLSVTVLQFVVRAITGQNSDWAIVTATILIAYIFQPLRQYLQTLVDRKFYREKVDFRQAFRTFARDMRQYMDLSELLQVIVSRLTDFFHSSIGAIYLYQTELHHFQLAEVYYGDQTRRTMPLILNRIEQLNTGEPVVRTNNDPFAVWVPLMAYQGDRHELIGVLALGPKRSGIGYGYEDLALLATLVDEAGSAISLAQAVTEKNRVMKERDAAEAETREQREWYRVLFENSPQGILVADAETYHFLYANPKICQMLGYSVGELAQMSLADIHPPEALAHIESEFIAQSRGEKIMAESLPCRRKDGTAFFADVAASPLIAAGRHCTVGFFTDVTERKNAEAALHISHTAEQEFSDRLGALSEVTTELSKSESLDALCKQVVELGKERLGFDRISLWFISEDRTYMVGTYGVDAEGNITDEHLEQVHIDPQSHISPIIQGKVPLVAQTSSLLYSRGLVEGQGTRLTAGLWDGETVIGFMSVDNLRNQEPINERDSEILQLYASAVGHLCSLKRTQEALTLLTGELERRVADRTAQLEYTNKELDAFNYSISHDLRAPLRSLDGFSRALEEDYADQLDEQAREYLRRIRTGSQRMNELISDLLKLSRLKRGAVQRVPVDLSALADEIVRELAAAHPNRRVEMTIAPGLQANGDPFLLRIALENLLGNAWKFTGRCDLARIEFASRLDSKETIFWIRDNGVGFDMTYANKLFDVFQRLHSTDEFDGTGVGLTIVQRIIHQHGGRVWAEAEVEQGATFYFTLESAK